MVALSFEFVRKVAEALEEEETDIYTLALYMMNTGDLDYFNAADRKRVKKIFQSLIEDTKQHADILKLIVELASGNEKKIL